MEFSEWMDSRIKADNSCISGKGLFTSKDINEGEVIIRFGGRVFDENETKLARMESVISFSKGLFVGYFKSDPVCPSDFLNHSCAPNVGMHDTLEVEAIRNIKAGEEILIDYGFFCSGFILPSFLCQCGAEQCRKIITSDDWMMYSSCKYISPALKGRFF